MQFPPETRARIQLFLKITANAGGYGIYVEHNRVDLPKGRKVTVEVHAGGDPFTITVAAPEEPRTYACPPLAAVITGAARLMLALLERSVTDRGGSWAFADTDSMAIVTTPTRGIDRFRGWAHRDAAGRAGIQALSHYDVDDIRDRFTALNPYRQSVVAGSIPRRELDANSYAVAAKRYALYRYDPSGLPRLVPDREHEPCRHGLGHLLNPFDPEGDDRAWTVRFWEVELARRLTGQRSRRPPHSTGLRCARSRSAHPSPTDRCIGITETAPTASRSSRSASC